MTKVIKAKFTRDVDSIFDIILDSLIMISMNNHTMDASVLKNKTLINLFS